MGGGGSTDRAALGPDPDAASFRRPRVLVVDDDPTVLRSFRRALRTHDLATATNGREALEILSKDPGFDVILCDLMMPEITGMDIYERLRELGGGLERRMVFLSGALLPNGRARFSTPCRTFVSKSRSIHGCYTRYWKRARRR